MKVRSLSYKRVFVSVLFASMLSLSMYTSAYAAEGSVVYVEGAHNTHEFVITPSKDDLLPSLSSLMPADTKTCTIELRSDEKNKERVYIYLKSLGHTQDTQELLSHIDIEVIHNTSSLSANKAHLAGNLSDWVYLGEFYPGDTTELVLTISVPATLDNSLSLATGVFEWQFLAEEIPQDIDTPSPSPDISDKDTPSQTILSSLIQTGDSTWCVVAALIFFICVCLVVLFVVYKQTTHRS